MKHILTAVIACFLFFLSGAQSSGRLPFFARSFAGVDFDYENAYIKIDDKEATYAELLRMQDSNMLKVELYSKKRAGKQFGKDIGKHGVILFTTKKVKEKPKVITSGDSLLYYQMQGFDAAVKGLVSPTLNGDTTARTWVKFLQKTLRADTPTEQGAPMGLYKVMVKFVVNKDGSVSDAAVEEDPGYGTKAEAIRVASLSPAWQPATYKGEAVRCYQRAPITFLVVEM